MYLKLLSGEEIVSFVRSYNSSLVELIAPLQVNYHQNENNSIQVSLGKWLPLTDNVIMAIQSNNVCTMTYPNDQTIETYTKTINHMNMIEQQKLDKDKPAHPLYSWDHDGLLPN